LFPPGCDNQNLHPSLIDVLTGEMKRYFTSPVKWRAIGSCYTAAFVGGGIHAAGEVKFGFALNYFDRCVLLR
jgi:hypothetical protein